jgi:hypothetical protein
MSKHKVGDVISVSVKIVEVHPQGYPSGLDKHGRPSDPTEQPNPDTVICEFADDVEVDAAKRLHLRMPADA